MAILKHIASKSSNYGAALEYLIFKHDELRKTPILDQNGNRIMRDEFYLDGLNCEPYSFDAACQQLNREYQKNKNKDEIKSHHYIVSFDPRDSTENCLTGKRAQELGLEYAKANFPGHQALVCTHMDGHNGSGNIHVHIVINSLRKLDVPQQPFMERPIDCKAGYKHHVTNEYLKHLQKSLMDLCLEGFFVQNAEKNLRYKEDPILIFTTRTRLRLVVDLQENVKAQENLAYALKVKISNLQKMAETLVWVQENNINDLTELNDLCKTAQSNAQAAYERLSQAEDELYKTNEQIHYAGQYLSTKDVQQQFAKAIFKKKFRAEHSKELDAYAESVKYFREENDGKLPSLKSLKQRKEELTKEIAERKKAYAPLREESRRLEIASDNVYSIFRKTNEMKSDLAWKREWEANVREKARQEQARQEQRERQPKRKKRSYDMSL